MTCVGSTVYDGDHKIILYIDIYVASVKGSQQYYWCVSSASGAAGAPRKANVIMEVNKLQAW